MTAPNFCVKKDWVCSKALERELMYVAYQFVSSLHKLSEVGVRKDNQRSSRNYILTHISQEKHMLWIEARVQMFQLSGDRGRLRELKWPRGAYSQRQGSPPADTPVALPSLGKPDSPSGQDWGSPVSAAPVQNENGGPLFKPFLRISRWQWQSVQVDTRAFQARSCAGYTLVNLPGHWKSCALGQAPDHPRPPMLHGCPVGVSGGPSWAWCELAGVQPTWGGCRKWAARGWCTQAPQEVSTIPLAVGLSCPLTCSTPHTDPLQGDHRGPGADAAELHHAEPHSRGAALPAVGEGAGQCAERTGIRGLRAWARHGTGLDEGCPSLGITMV